MEKAIILLITVFCVGSVEGGEYALTSGWPTGIRDRKQIMLPSQKARCKELTETVLKTNTINKQLFCDFLENTKITGENLIQWSTPPLEEAIRIKSQLFNGYIDEEEVKKEISEMPKGSKQNFLRIAKIKIFKQFALKSPDEEYEKLADAVLVKFSAGTCSDLTEVKTVRPGPWVRYGLSFEDDLSDLKILGGSSSSEEEFIWKNQIYFISFSYRTRDDTFQFEIYPEQQVININKLYQGRRGESLSLLRACRLLYWKDGEKRFE